MIGGATPGQRNIRQIHLPWHPKTSQTATNKEYPTHYSKSHMIHSINSGFETKPN
jgi:hypothetical protein